MADLIGELVDLSLYEEVSSNREMDGDSLELVLVKDAVLPRSWPSMLTPPAPPLAGLYTSYYLMRGFRHLHAPTPDFETWVAAGVPNALNPSGEPIQDVSIQLAWFEVNL
jgi:hypothetical protein